MSDIRQWLQSLDLGEYADAFEENRVDLSLISDLDHTVLKEIGVTVIGDRIRILKAAQNAESETDSHKNESTHASRPSLQVHPGSEAERRHLTVLFCDLVGSTALSESMDPEQYRDVLTTYQSAAAAAVQRFDGYIARYMGDGLLVYFGYPQAHEDDAERAIRTGFQIIDRVAALPVKDGSELHVRIGVSTGLVVVGDIVGEGASEERAVVGDTPNLAARLQSVAEADTVYLSDSTRRLVAGRFECEDLGARALKGFSQPVPIWRLIRERVVDSRFEARVSGPIGALFGREHELGLILDRWRQSQAGEGQMVFLSGEAGMGKSIRSPMLITLESYTSARPTTPTVPCIRRLNSCAGRLGSGPAITSRRSSTSWRTCSGKAWMRSAWPYLSLRPCLAWMVPPATGSFR
jgi:class 3 adenylate cyclase